MSESVAARATPGPGLWLYGVAAGVVALDQLTKALIARSLEPGASVAVLGSLLSFTRRSNTGGAFSMLQDCPLVLVVVSAVVLVGVLALGPRLAGPGRMGLVGLGMVAGGAAGNLLDRLRLGNVADFIDFHFWPVFNVADIGITVGAALVVIAVLGIGERTMVNREQGTGDGNDQ
jgi:signal peptidase II